MSNSFDNILKVAFTNAIWNGRYQLSEHTAITGQQYKQHEVTIRIDSEDFWAMVKEVADEETDDG